MPPTRFIGLPWVEWGETDRLLVQATAIARDAECGCGCGQWVDECTDEGTDGRWEISTSVCYARNAIDAWAEKHKDDLEPGQMIGAHLVPEGVEPVDPLDYNPDRAAAERAALEARLTRG